MKFQALHYHFPRRAEVRAWVCVLGMWSRQRGPPPSGSPPLPLRPRPQDRSQGGFRQRSGGQVLSSGVPGSPLALGLAPLPDGGYYR